MRAIGQPQKGESIANKCFLQKTNERALGKPLLRNQLNNPFEVLSISISGGKCYKNLRPVQTVMTVDDSR